MHKTRTNIHQQCYKTVTPYLKLPSSISMKLPAFDYKSADSSWISNNIVMIRSTMVDVGPSPLIPFLMVITLWYIIYGHSVVNSVLLISQFEKMSLDFLVIIPILVLLLLVFSTQSIIVPLMFILLVLYMVSKTLLGPLILIILIYVFSVGRFDNGGGRGRYDDDSDSEGYQRDRDDGNVGCGFILFIVMFMVLLGLFYQGEGYDWRTALLVIVIFILCNLIWF